MVDSPARQIEDYLSGEELARVLGCSLRTLRRWRLMRVGPPCVKIGRHFVYRVEAASQWLREQERFGELQPAAPGNVNRRRKGGAA